MKLIKFEMGGFKGGKGVGLVLFIVEFCLGENKIEFWFFWSFFSIFNVILDLENIWVTIFVSDDNFFVWVGNLYDFSIIVYWVEKI